MDEHGVEQSKVAIAEAPVQVPTPLASRANRAPVPNVRAQRVHVDADSKARVIEALNEDSLPNRQETGFVGSRAEFADGDPLVDAPAAKKEEKKQDVAPKGQAGDPEKKGQSELLLGKFKTDADVRQGYLDLEVRFTQQAQQLAELKKPAAAVESDLEPGDLEIDPALAEELFSSPQTAVKKIVAKAVDNALTAFKNRDQKKSRETSVKDVQDWFKKDHAPLVQNLKAMQAIEGLAASAEGATLLEKFQHATKDYLSLVGAASETGRLEAAATAAATEQQVEAAGMPENRKGAGEGKKVWKQSDIDWMIENDRPQYQRLSLEIAKARREGRVRDDL